MKALIWERTDKDLSERQWRDFVHAHSGATVEFAAVLHDMPKARNNA